VARLLKPVGEWGPGLCLDCHRELVTHRSIRRLCMACWKYRYEHKLEMPPRLNEPERPSFVRRASVSRPKPRRLRTNPWDTH